MIGGTIISLCSLVSFRVRFGHVNDQRDIASEVEKVCE